MKTVYVNDYGATSDGKTLCSVAVQRAIDDCFALGGGTVKFGSGEYVLSTVFLKSNVKIEIPKGTVILGAPSFYDYAPEEKIDYTAYQDSSHTFFDCSLFVAKNCENIAITGGGKIDMRSVWDEDYVRRICHRGPKCIALKLCKNVEISNLQIYNATDLAVYFAGCENVDVFGLIMRVYIDGISPDNSKNVRIFNCDVESGDDGIVFKSSYNLNRLEKCADIHVFNCRVKSLCSAIKFGTETNGGFENIVIENIDVRETRISGIAIESVDGAIIDGITIKNVTMRNVNVPLFIHVGRRMRGPEGLSLGEIKNVLIENLTAEGPYEPYRSIVYNYDRFIETGATEIRYPWVFGGAASVRFEKLTKDDAWQMTSNVCGLPERPLKNITLKNVKLRLDGGVKTYCRDVPETAQDYPEAFVYGKILPAKGIYFRHIDGLVLDNVTAKTYRDDAREEFVFDDVKNRLIK